MEVCTAETWLVCACMSCCWAITYGCYKGYEAVREFQWRVMVEMVVTGYSFDGSMLQLVAVLVILCCMHGAGGVSE